MGRPVIHFEVMGADGEKLRRFYHDLFGWAFDAGNSLGYGIVQRETNAAASGSATASAGRRGECVAT